MYPAVPMIAPGIVGECTGAGEGEVSVGSRPALSAPPAPPASLDDAPATSAARSSRSASVSPSTNSSTNYWWPSASSSP